MKSSLAGLELLLVRPKTGPEDFVEILAGEGAKIHHHPVMSIKPNETLSVGPLTQELSGYDKAIFISRTAAQLALSHLKRAGSEWPASLSAYAVGASTARIIASSGIHVEIPSLNMTSEGLLALPELNTVSGQRVIIFCGEGGRSLLTEELVRRGARVERFELYRREPCGQEKTPIVNLVERQKIQVIVVHSGELLRNLLTVLGETRKSDLSALTILVPSRRVAEQAKNAGFERILTAKSAITDDMVSALREWYSEQ